MVNPADKYRGGNSASDILKNAEAEGRKRGVEVAVGDDYLKIGEFEARWAGGVVETSFGKWRAERRQWDAFKTLLLNYFVNFGKSPDRHAVEAALFAAGVGLSSESF